MTHGQKTMVFLTAPDRAARAEFQHAVLDLARHTLPDVRVVRLTVNLVEMPPAGIPYRPDTELSTGDQLPAYDAVLEVTAPGATRSVWLDEFAAAIRTGLWHEFSVEEHVEKNEQPFVPGSRSPGMKYMGRLMFHSDLPDSAVRRSWNLHVGLALRVHAGAAKYVRNWVVTRSPHAPETRGITELHFRSIDDLVRRFFDSEDGKAQVLHDLAHFVASGNRLYCSEYVLKA